MNILQHLPKSKHGLVLVTLNPPFPVDPAKTVGKWTYHHPMMTTASVASQALLPKIQNTRNISYAGAWTRYGFHEDGFTSGMRLVTSAPFHVTPPFPLRPATRSTNQSGVILMTSRGIVGSLERIRRRLEPAWQGVVWVVVFGFVWLEQVLSAVRLTELRDEVARIREGWAGNASGKKRQ
jgi:hypothetical protein